ncbi:MAG: TonB-dependent receptor plug domain-containing protein [Bacteroidetes bacterium]|nr:TonB-dependent receptor plug domain-containing protein [Bacteroidota bacterium]
MFTTAYYFVQVILCSGIMMGYYWLVLRNKRFHHYNRFYLLALALLSWVVPLVKIRWQHPTVTDDLQVLQLLSVVADNNTRLEAAVTRSGFQWNWDMTAWILYLVVASVLLAGLVNSFIRLYRLLKQHSCKNVGDVYLVLTQAPGTPFSFFRYIFWNEEIDLRSEAGKQILQHELTHVQQKHSLDKLFVQLVLVAGWFNPFFWLLKKEMEMIHEFIADKKAVGDGDTAALAQMLLTAAYPQQRFGLSNPFFFSPIKRRLQMLTNNRNPRFSYLRRLVVLPMLAVMVLLFAFRRPEQRAKGPLSVATVVENMVEKTRTLLPGIHPADTIVIQADTVYIQGKDKTDVLKIIPSVAKNKELRKALIILDGKKVDPAVLDTLNTKAVATVDILDGKDAATTSRYGEEAKNGVVLITTQSTKMPQPLVILDGRKIDHDSIASINPAQIQSVNVLKNGSATALYGEDGRNGVILITSKTGLMLETPTASGLVANNLSQKINSRKLGVTKVTVRAHTDSLPKDVLILVDGVKGSLASVQPEDIAAVNVHKDSASISRYGDEARNGVVEIVTKRPFSVKTEAVARPVLKGYKIFTEVENLPAFPGGQATWKEYLMRNQRSDLARNGTPPGTYTVQLSFLVAEDGTVSNVTAVNNPGHRTVEEAIRLIKNGPNWIPARQNGQPVLYRHRQAITLVVKK